METPVTFNSSELKLEGWLAAPRGASHAVVICHPHPQYGGDMDNNVVVAVATRLQRSGIATLRFNFRGTGASQGSYDHGVGEGDDARSATELLRQRTGLATVTLAGYSFGAIIALKAGHDHAGVDRLVAVAPPATMFDLSFLDGCPKPKLLILGDRDQYCPYPALAQATTAMIGETQLEKVRGADHFFAGFEDRVSDSVLRFLR
jgi:alpha/beta superfamily hydrolase